MARRPSPQTLSVIEAFLEQPQVWLYGYDIFKTLGMASGTLYPILIRLSDRGHLETLWQESETTGRPPRHMYRLTATGRAWSAAVAHQSQRLRTAEGLA